MMGHNQYLQHDLALRCSVRPLLRHALPGLALLLLMQGCGPASLETGVYRAALETPVGELPFHLEFVAQADERWHAAIVVGNDRIETNQVMSTAGRLQARFAATTFEATIGRRSLEGRVSFSIDGQEQVLPFNAQAGAVHRFYDESSTDNADIAGLWVIEQSTGISSGSESSTLLTVEIRQSHDQLDMSVASDTDDVSDLIGQIKGDAFSFARFDGTAAIMYRGTFTNSGRLAGDYWSISAGRGQWTAKPSDVGFFNP